MPDLAELPHVDDVFRLYDENDLEAFVEAGETLLEREVPMSQHDSILLHILLGICLSDPHDTLDHYQSAKAMFWPWKYHHDEGDVPALEDLEPKLEKMGKLVEEERIAWMKEQGYPVDLEDEEDDTDVEVIEIEDIEGVEGMTDQRRDSPWMQLWQSAVRAIRTMGWSGWVLRGIV